MEAGRVHSTRVIGEVGTGVQVGVGHQVIGEVGTGVQVGVGHQVMGMQENVTTRSWLASGMYMDVVCVQIVKPSEVNS